MHLGHGKGREHQFPIHLTSTSIPLHGAIFVILKYMRHQEWR